MRRISAILIAIGLSLSAAVGFLLLFWFAFPRWWPETVIRYSPSLEQVLLADSYRSERSAGTVRVRSYPEEGVPDYARFTRPGTDIYASMATHDDGIGGRKRSSIIRFLSQNLDQQKARIWLWKWRDEGDKRADSVLARYTNSLQQGIDRQMELRWERMDMPLYWDRNDMPWKDEIRSDKLGNEWK